jgi:hypothetical protein
MHHVALVGYGTLLVPRVPFEVGGTSAELDDLVVVHHTAPSLKSARIAPSSTGCGLQLAPGTTSIDDVALELSQVDVPAGWWLELDALAVPRPPGVTLWSVPAETAWAAELTLPGGARDEMAYLLGPFTAEQAPVPEALVGAGTIVVADERREGPQGSVRMVELSYQHEGQAFRQWRGVICAASSPMRLKSARRSGLSSMARLRTPR